MRAWSGYLGTLVLVACVGGQPTPSTTSADTSSKARGDAALAAAPSDAATFDAATVDAAVVKSVVDAGTPHETKVVAGSGACKQDSDCVLASWQPGCCLSTCIGYAISKRELDRQMSAEKCPPPGTQLCPPPAPCPVFKYRPIAAVCRKGTCSEVRELLR